MKETPGEARIRERMKPGVLCADGFLGDDRRRVGEIIDADRAAAERAGTTLDALADRLGGVLDAAVAGLGGRVELPGGQTAVWREAMGRIPCPFGGCGTFPKGEVELTGPGGETVRFTPLSVHLLAEHGFAQGRGSRYRLEPALLARLFG